MRIRTIKPEFWTSRSNSQLSSDSVRLHFIGLWNYCDDSGRGVDDPDLLKAAIWPRDKKKTVKVVEDYQNQLHKAGKIIRYEAEGERYFAVTSWKDHQRLDHPKDSTIPSPDSGKILTPKDPAVPVPKTSGRVPIASRLEVEGNREVEGKGSLALAPLGAEVARPDTPQQAMFAALAEGCGWNVHEITASARGGLGKAAKELLNVGATPDEVPGRASAYRRKYPNAALTPTALAKHWASCEPARQPLPTRMAGISVLMGGASA